VWIEELCAFVPAPIITTTTTITIAAITATQFFAIERAETPPPAIAM